MRLSTLAVFLVVAGTPGLAVAQQAPSQNLQSEADKGVATKNSGASGYVADEQKPGSATHAPGEPNCADNSTATAPSAQNSGAGISGAAGGKIGPADFHLATGFARCGSVRSRRIRLSRKA